MIEWRWRYILSNTGDHHSATVMNRNIGRSPTHSKRRLSIGTISQEQHGAPENCWSMGGNVSTRCAKGWGGEWISSCNISSLNFRVKPKGPVLSWQSPSYVDGFFDWTNCRFQKNPGPCQNWILQGEQTGFPELQKQFSGTSFFNLQEPPLA